MNIAVIIAGGSGQRMGQDIPKQFLVIEDKPVIIYTLEKFQNSSVIDKIFVACISGWETVLSAYSKQYNITKLAGVVQGGATRSNSVYNVLSHIKTECSDNDIVMIFDANRPMISDEMIEDAVAKCREHGAASGIRPCYESMFRCESTAEFVGGTEDRNTLYVGTGPETVKYGIAVKVFEDFLSDNMSLTVTEMLLKKGLPVAASKSDPTCIKLTTAEDISIFRALLKTKKYAWFK